MWTRAQNLDKLHEKVNTVYEMLRPQAEVPEQVVVHEIQQEVPKELVVAKPEESFKDKSEISATEDTAKNQRKKEVENSGQKNEKVESSERAEADVGKHKQKGSNDENANKKQKEAICEADSHKLENGQSEKIGRGKPGLRKELKNVHPRGIPTSSPATSLRDIKGKAGQGPISCVALGRDDNTWT